MKSTSKTIVEAKVCGTCANYRQHYVLGADGRWQPLWYGHCHKPKPRYPEPDGSCPRWTGFGSEASIGGKYE